MELPLEQRIFCYKKAIDIIENSKAFNGIEDDKNALGNINYSLCRLLPCIAFGLNAKSHAVFIMVKNGTEISRIFPEIDLNFVTKMTASAVKGTITVTSANTMRVSKLKEALNQLNNGKI